MTVMNRLEILNEFLFPLQDEFTAHKNFWTRFAASIGIEVETTEADLVFGKRLIIFESQDAERLVVELSGRRLEVHVQIGVKFILAFKSDILTSQKIDQYVKSLFMKAEQYQAEGWDDHILSIFEEEDVTDMVSSAHNLNLNPHQMSVLRKFDVPVSQWVEYKDYPVEWLETLHEF